VVADDNEFILVQQAQPVLEPGGWAMLLAGLGVLSLMARLARSLMELCGRR